MPLYLTDGHEEYKMLPRHDWCYTNDSGGRPYNFDRTVPLPGDLYELSELEYADWESRISTPSYFNSSVKRSWWDTHPEDKVPPEFKWSFRFRPHEGRPYYERWQRREERQED